MRPQRRRRFLVVALATLLAGCDSTVPPPSRVEVPGESPDATAAPSVQPSGIVPQPTAEPAGAPGLVLSEVGFAHGSEAAFIELWNAGAAAVDLRDAGLALDGAPLPFTAPAEALAPGGRFVLRFDYVLGETPAPGAAHLLPDQGPRPGGGTLDLQDALGRPVDHVAWGNAPDPVRTGLGGVVPEALQADWTIGRAPGATSADDRLAWVPYGAGEGTPGAANPLPGVPVLLPFSGAVFETTTAKLTWYPAPGATGYRIQVAGDASFGAIVREETTTSPGLTVDGLAPGAFFWRVQATGPNGLASAFTGTATFEVTAATAGVTTALARPGAGAAALTAVEPDAAKRLAVPLLDQHKDSEMLLLERNVRDQPHPWDLDHGALDEDDPSDNMNCVLASVAMISAFACPNCHMSQDRIGYEVFKGRLPGPERDLNFGDGLYPAQIQAAIDFALVTANVQGLHDTVPDRIWSTLRAQIDAGKPVLVVRPNGGGGSHATVITGYMVAGGRRTLFANDPWSGLVTYAIANSAVANANDWWDYYPINGPLLGRQQELSVSSDDDGDGVVDFDETERFRTDPADEDTDRDGVPDKADILSTVFDATYGYALSYRVGTAFPRMDGRDFDRDGLPNERDPDSDNGDCKDGDEDKNLDGMRDPGETWNFLAGDDPCRPLSGGLQWTSSYAVGSDESWQRVVESFSLSARLKPDPADPTRAFLDDGSTFSYVIRTSSFVLGIDGCDDHSDSRGTKTGRFAPGDFKASIVPEFENGKDGLGLGISVSVDTRGRHWNCLIDEQITGTAYFGADDFCWGLEDGDDGIPAHTFVFTCGDTIGGGWFGRTWSLSGTIVVG